MAMRDERPAVLMLMALADALELRNAIAAGYGGRGGRPNPALLDAADAVETDIRRALSALCADGRNEKGTDE